MFIKKLNYFYFLLAQFLFFNYSLMSMDSDLRSLTQIHIKATTSLNIISCDFSAADTDATFHWDNWKQMSERLSEINISFPYDYFAYVNNITSNFLWEDFFKDYPEFHTLKNKIIGLSYKDLAMGIKLIVPEIIERLKQVGKNSKFSVGYSVGRSTQWILAYALLQFPQDFLPSSTFKLYPVDSYSSSFCYICNENDKALEPEEIKEKTFVFFDDVSYTGSQLLELISRLKSQIEFNENDQIRIIVGIPFITQCALEKIMKEKLILPKNIQVEIITTNKKLFSLNDLPEESYPKSWNSDNLFSAGPSLVFTDWKIPDSFSFPKKLIKYINRKHSSPVYRHLFH